MSNQHLDNLQEIRGLMEKSSRFISLSGLSGVVAGLSALLGAFVAVLYFQTNIFYPGFYKMAQSFPDVPGFGGRVNGFHLFFLFDAFVVLSLALVGGIFFTRKKAKKDGVAVWGGSSKRMLKNLAVPLCFGGLFCVILFHWGLIGLVAPTTMLFYGMALLNASRDTVKDIRYLGLCQMILGILGAYFIGYGLLFWTIGFGVLHIFYGLIIYYKYEKNR